MDCKVIDQQLVTHSLLAQHLAGCASCRAAYDEVEGAMAAAERSVDRPGAHVKARLAKAFRARPVVLIALAGLAAAAAAAAFLNTQSSAPTPGHGRPVDTARDVPLNLDTL